MCVPHTGIALLGAPFMHIWAAYQICGAKQEICGGVSCMQQWVMHICTTLWACHRWAHLASLGCGLTTNLCILTLLLDKLLKWLSCQPFSQISWAHTFPRSKPPRLIRGWRWQVSCSKKRDLLRIRQLLVRWWTRLKCLSPFFPRPWRWHKKRTSWSKTKVFHTGPGNQPTT